VRATACLAYCSNHGAGLWACAQGLIRQALAGLAEKGARVGNTDVLTRLAEAQALDGATNEALDTIEVALKTNPEELVFRPNTLKYRGELRRGYAKRRDPSDRSTGSEPPRRRSV
jgi:hypothetical protein